ncbi:MAG: hypothetical protein ACON4I_00530 [Candidatus Puniceispirillaceae bacterium]
MMKRRKDTPPQGDVPKCRMGGTARFLRFAAMVAMAWLVPGLMLATPAIAAETLPCEVMVKFEDDEVGAATIYRLRLQYKNRTGRDITHVSVLTTTSEEVLVGNSQLDCRVDEKALKPGDTGECHTDLQVITGRMAARLNFDDWLGMIRDQQDKLATIKICDIVGTRFSHD